jgi:hypothetical protein
MVLGITSLGLLLLSAGFSSVISLACAIVAIPFGRKGKRLVDEGATRKGRGFAQAGYITGIVGVALSILATIGWVLFFVLIENFSSEFDSNFYDDFDFEQQSAPLIAVRLTASLTRAVTG